MRRIKIISVFTALGFLISFVFGLFSGKNILFVLIEALIFAVVFALLGFGIDFLFQTFLADDSGNDLTTDTPNINTNSPASSEKKGQYVDLTIQDEELPDGTSQNHFVVNDNHQMLNNSDIVHSPSAASSAQEEAPKETNPGFVPLKNYETINTLSSKEAVSPEAIQDNSSYGEVPKEDNNLDVLPDMENLSFGSSSSSGSSDDEDTDIGDTSDFSTSVSGSRSKTLEDVGIQDAALMAKAISSALSGEDS